MTLPWPAERLYLEKDGPQNILIDLPKPLPQHQLDGIRYLFRQYKKKALGVILNDPSGYGKCVQIVMFLNALRPILKEPILILSNDVNNWKEHFNTWTNCSDDELAIETSNLNRFKKGIFINPIKDGAALTRRAWSIVVTHDEDSTIELLRMNFNTNFKIWVTSNDLKKDLYTLASIYEWLHPRQKFKVELFTAKKNNKDVVEKALLLDAFLEDFLIRRTDFFMPFFKPEKLKPSLPSPVKATRKNKDPTGTKVKRSKKRRIEDDDDVNMSTVPDETKNSNKRIIDTKKNNKEQKTSGAYVSNNDNNDMDVESFIRNEKPIETVEFDFIQNSNNKTSPEIDNVSQSIDFSAAVKDIIQNEKLKNHSKVEDSHNDVGSPIIIQGTDNNAQVNVEENQITDDEDKREEKRCKIIVPATEDGCDSQSIFSNNENTIHIENDKATRKSEVYIPETESENAESSVTTFRNDNSVDEEESNDWKIEEEIVTNEKLVSKGGDNNSSKSIRDFDKSVINSDNTLNKSNEVIKKMTKVEEFDAELAEMEAKALKKFKSSILDSLF